MTPETVESAARDYRAALQNSRDALSQSLRDAQQSGASIAQLMAWTGYSRRRVFQLLKEGK